MEGGRRRRGHFPRVGDSVAGQPYDLSVASQYGPLYPNGPCDLSVDEDIGNLHAPRCSQRLVAVPRAPRAQHPMAFVRRRTPDPRFRRACSGTGLVHWLPPVGGFHGQSVARLGHLGLPGALDRSRLPGLNSPCTTTESQPPLLEDHFPSSATRRGTCSATVVDSEHSSRVGPRRAQCHGQRRGSHMGRTANLPIPAETSLGTG